LIILSDDIQKNVLVMEFVGRDGIPSPTLVETEVEYDDYKGTIETVTDLYLRAKTVHVYLSEYNIFKMDKNLIVFDFCSIVDIRYPNVKEFLESDIKNITKFFAKRGLTVENPIDMFERLAK
jgi:RIO kinase 1